MKVPLLSLLLVACAGGLDLPPPERPYNFLVILVVSGPSHRNVFKPLVKELAGRGHKLTVLSNLPPTFSHDNIEEVKHGIEVFDPNQNMFEIRKQKSKMFVNFQAIQSKVARELYRDEKAMEVYARRKTFDLILIDHLFNEAAYPFLHEMPFITVSTPPGIDWRQSALLGNVFNPAYTSVLFEAMPKNMNFLQRASNLFKHIIFPVMWQHVFVVPEAQKEISLHFPDLPPLMELERNQSLTLLNSHFSGNHPIPLLPTQVEVGSMHCQAAKPLPEDLEAWISGAGSNGVVYFSLGSVTKGDSMPVEYRDLFVQAFARIKQRVIWKYEGQLEVSDNVYLGKWLPQQDILAHPGVRVFISHGGGLSMQETLYHGTPVLVIPIFGDQPRNGQYLQEEGYGLSLEWDDLTVDLIVNSIQDLVNNPKYQAAVTETSAYAKDRPERPVDRAVYWTEYVIRHGGAPRLRTPARLLSWREYLMLDVLLLIQVLAYVAYRLTKCLLCCVYRKAVGAKQKPKLE